MEFHYKLDFATEIHGHRSESDLRWIVLLILAVAVIWLLLRFYPSNLQSSNSSNFRTVHEYERSTIKFSDMVQEPPNGAPLSQGDTIGHLMGNEPSTGGGPSQTSPEVTVQEPSDNERLPSDNERADPLSAQASADSSEFSRCDSMFDPSFRDTQPAVPPKVQSRVTSNPQQTINLGEDAKEHKDKTEATSKGESEHTQTMVPGINLQAPSNKSELGNGSHNRHAAPKQFSSAVICLYLLFISYAIFITFSYVFILLADTHFGKIEPMASFTRKTLQEVVVQIGDPDGYHSQWVLRDVGENQIIFVEQVEAHILKAEQTLSSLQDELTSIAISQGNKTKHDVVVSNFKILEDGIQQLYRGVGFYKGNITELAAKQELLYRILDQATTNTPLVKAKSFTGDLGTQIRTRMMVLSDPYAAATIALNQSLPAIDVLHDTLIDTIQHFPPSIPGWLRDRPTKAEASAFQVSRRVEDALDGAKGWLQMGARNAARYERAYRVSMRKWERKEEEKSLTRAASSCVSHTINRLVAPEFQNWVARSFMQYGRRHAFRLLTG